MAIKYPEDEYNKYSAPSVNPYTEEEVERAKNII